MNVSRLSRWIDPLVTVAEHDQQRARIIALIALLGMVLFLPLSLTAPIINRTLTANALLIRIVGLLLACAIYVLVRRGRVELSANLLVISGFVTTYAVALYTGFTHTTGALQSLNALALVTLFAALVLSLRASLLTWVLTLVSIMLVPLLDETIRFADVISIPLLFNLLGGSFSLLIIHFYRREQARLKEALSERERRFRLLADKLPQFITRVDSEGRLLYINERVQAFIGLTLEEVQGKTRRDLLDVVPSLSVSYEA
jgi:PAS domain-containing protein